MPRFCANLTMLFTEMPLLERPEAAARAGFKSVELLFPYDTNAAELGSALARSGLSLSLINCPPPNYTDGPRGFAAIPGLQSRFRQDFKRSLRYATVLGVQHLHIMAGVAEGEDARKTFVENLTWAASVAPKQSLTIEPINSMDMPGYFLSSFDQAMAILDEINAPNLHLQFDAYHAYHITGDVLGTWENVRRRTVHVQVAGVPGRHEPRAGQIDYPGFFKKLDADGYDGLVSGEYRPVAGTMDGLDWIK
ncbi:hydroxypyruvate isomerase family protein [Aestuariibius sp. HNIBRBA575]|uniref:hydroxypyruvate isomerase family protein n=1 Tax=Aestuariibius sp. HNIBRBA575 TaxID=3233343 RepID=UPI0034A2A4BF